MCGSLRGQTKIVSLTVKDPRPPAATARQLEGPSGVFINFEDTLYENASDVEDVTASAVKPEYRTSNKVGVPIRVAIPRGGELSLSLGVDTTTGKPAAPSATLMGVLDAHHAKEFPGVYALGADSSGFMISLEGGRGAGGGMLPA